MSARDFAALPALELQPEAAQALTHPPRAMQSTAATDSFQADMAAKLQAIAAYAQINLLPAADTNTRVRVMPWWSPLACASVVVAAALGSSGPLNSALSQKRALVQAADVQLQEKTSQLEAASKALQGGTLTEQTLALQAAVTQQERLLALMGGAGGAIAAGTIPAGTAFDPAAPRALTQDFSVLLEALSRTRVDGLWLTQLRIDKRSQELKIEGSARDAQMVSSYIDELSRNPRFKGLVVTSVDVVRAAPGSAPTNPLATGAAAPTNAEPARFKLSLATASTVPPTPMAAAVAARNTP